MAYGVRVRNSPEPDAWAVYVRRVREAAGLTKAALAKRLDINRATVFRWESGSQHPEPAAVIAVADAFGLDVNEALAVAGYLPTAEPPPERPTTQRDPLVQWILDNPELTEDEKLALIKRELDRQARERTDRIAELDWMIRERGRHDPNDRAS
jgi:transcriptional regulator with XRE-family HTH domain